MRAVQDWAAQVLGSAPSKTLPSHRPLAGALVGFAGILLIAGPFLREAVGKKPPKEIAASGVQISFGRVCLEFATGSILIVLLLRYWNPQTIIGVFQGDYLASFLLLLGVALVLAHWRPLRSALSAPVRALAAAAFAALVLHLLVTAWFDLSFYVAWLTAAKWARFPMLFIAVLPYHVAEEFLLGEPQTGRRWQRLAAGLSLRLISWGALMMGVMFLHSGEILMGLLAPYLAVFNLIQRGGMDIVRNETGSVTATALFGAILLAGFCLVIFPIT